MRLGKEVERLFVERGAKCEYWNANLMDIWVLVFQCNIRGYQIVVCCLMDVVVIIILLKLEDGYIAFDVIFVIFICYCASDWYLEM